jgi:hypothetical protein
VIDDRIVVIGVKWQDDAAGYVPAIWWEDGDLEWREASVPEVSGDDRWLSDIVSGGPGLVAVGTTFDGDSLRALLWLSTDGKTWQATDATELDPHVWNATYYGPRATLAADESGLILFGRDGEEGGTNVALTSSDGQDWELVADEETMEMAAGFYTVTGDGTDLMAFDKRISPDACGEMTGGICQVGPVRMWMPGANLTQWKMFEELPDSEDGWIEAAAARDAMWVAVGAGAWVARDDLGVVPADTPPGAVALIFATPAGFVGVGGNEYGEYVGCCWNETWTSTDGMVWRHQDTIDGGIASVRRRGSTLIGIGMAGPTEGAVWTSKLP